MPSFIDHEFRPVILGADITAYSLVRTFYEAYGVKSLVVNMSDTPVIGYSELSEHVMVPNFHDLDVFLSLIHI